MSSGSSPPPPLARRSHLLLVSALLAVAVGSAGLASGVEAASASILSAVEAEALRAAIRDADAALLDRDPFEAALPFLIERLGREPAQVLTARARRHSPTRQRIEELVRLRLRWRRIDGQVFTFYWNHRQRSSGGLPSRAPTALEVVELEGVARDVADRVGVLLSSGIPFRVDLDRRGSRYYPREDLRWGVFTSRLMDRAAVVRAALGDLGSVPYLVEPLALLHGTCAGDAGCSEDALAEARETAVATGYVDLLTGLTAGTLGSATADPAFASALLMIDHLERTRSEAVLRLLEEVGPNVDREDQRRVVWSATGTTARRLDREVLRSLRRWARRPDR